jgi:predicted Zn-dependent protease
VRIARAIAVLAAVIACAWFVIGQRQAVSTERATTLLSGNAPVSARAAARVRSLLDEARFLNPDITPRLLAARLHVRQGDNAGAVRIITPLVRQEPMNLSVWVALAQATLHHDNRVLLDAVHTIARLDPKG